MKKDRLRLLFFLLLCLFFTPAWAQQQLKKRTLDFQAANGLNLQQDVYLPAGTGPFPVVLIRTPYGKYQYEGDGKYFAKNGYATVIQDVRGKFGSTGHFIPFLNETEDGLATLDWIAQQSWSNGQVGIYGISYSGFCGLTLSNKQHPALKAVVNFSGWVNPSTMAANGGAQQLMLNLTWLLHEETQTSRNIMEYELDSLFHYLPLSQVFQSIGIKSDAWEQPDLLSKVNTDFDYSKTNVPVLHLTGAYDFVKEATIEAFENMKSKSPTEQRLLFGPWFHNQSHTSLTEVGDVDFGATSLYGDDKVRDLALKWMDKHLQQQPMPALPLARVFLLFENQWFDFEHWPPKNIESTAFHIGSHQGAQSVNGDGFLKTTADSSNESDTFSYHPAKPVPTHGGANFHFFPAQLGIKDQSALEERTDILVYTSPPFEKEYAVIGSPIFNFHASTSAPDTDFTAKLVLVAPDGMAMNICDGIVRARHRNGAEKVELLESGKIYPFEIHLGSTAFKIPLAYRLRLEVSSSNFPKYNRNTNTTEDPFYSKTFKVAQQRIYHSKKWPAQLNMPMISMDQIIDKKQ